MAKKETAAKEAEEKKKTEEAESVVEETIKVKLTANIKYNTDRFKKGQKIEIKKSDYASLLKQGLIDER